MDRNNKIIVNTGILYIKMLLSMAFTLLSTRWVLEALGVNDYGIYNVVAGLIAMFSFLNTAMAVGTQRHLAYQLGTENIKVLKQTLKCSIVIHFFIGIIIVLMIEVLGVYFIKETLNFPEDRIDVVYIVLHTLSATTFFTIFQVPYLGLINAHENIYYIAIISVLEAALKFFTAFYLLYYDGDRLIMYSMLILLITVFSTIALALFCHIKYGEARKVYRENTTFTMLKYLLSYSSWNVLGALGLMVKGQGITMLYNTFFGVAVNAALGVSRQLNGQLDFFSNSIIRSFTPQIIKNEGEGDHARMIRLSCMASKISTLLMILIVVPFMFNLPYILGLWLKEVPEHTSVFAFISLIGSIIYQLYRGMEVSIHAVGEIKYYSIASMTVNIVVIPVSYILLSLGICMEIVLVVSVVGTFVNMLVTVCYVQKYCRFPVFSFLKQVFFPMAICIVTSFLVTGLLSQLASGLFSVIICFVMNAVVILVFFYYTALNKQEKDIAKKIIGKIKTQHSQIDQCS